MQKCHVHENPYSTFKSGCASLYKLGDEGLLLRSLALVPVSHRSADSYSDFAIPCGYATSTFLIGWGISAHTGCGSACSDRRVQPMTRAGRLRYRNLNRVVSFAVPQAQEMIKTLGEYSLEWRTRYTWTERAQQFEYLFRPFPRPTITEI